MKKVAATEFKAKCLKLIDQVHDSGQSITITKRGKIVAILKPAGEIDKKPWLKLQGTVKFYKGPFKPVLDERDIEALK
jgi:prevent-host-death family protein